MRRNSCEFGIQDEVSQLSLIVRAAFRRGFWPNVKNESWITERGPVEQPTSVSACCSFDFVFQINLGPCFCMGVKRFGTAPSNGFVVNQAGKPRRQGTLECFVLCIRPAETPQYLSSFLEIFTVTCLKYSEENSRIESGGVEKGFCFVASWIARGGFCEEAPYQ